MMITQYTINESRFALSVHMDAYIFKTTGRILMRIFYIDEVI
jgi:hypothetical protein